MRDHDRQPTVAVVALGCGRNEVDSENVAGLLSASGFRMVFDPERLSRAAPILVGVAD